MIRRLIREMLKEDLAGFVEKTKDIEYTSNFDDPTFDEPYQKDLPHKEYAKTIKRAWAAEADHEFMNSVIKVHWARGMDWNKKVRKLLAMSGKNEISTMGYLPDSTRVRGSWGTVGVIVQGRTTLAANSMNAIMSGQLGNVSTDVQTKYKTSGTPKRPTSFRQKGFFGDVTAANYILDRKTFKPEESSHNEFIIDNWKPVAIIVSQPGFLGTVREIMSNPADVRKNAFVVQYAKGITKFGLPIFDENLKPISKESIIEALKGEGEDEPFEFP